MICKCEWCGKEFETYPSRLKAKHICCSKQCQLELKKSLTEKNCTCPVCGKKFHCKPYHAKKYKNVFCSMECKKQYDSEKMKGTGNHQYGLKGKANASWKTDEKITNYGYRKIRVLEHPFRDCDDFVFEHRLVAEKYLLTEENSVEIDGKKYLKKEYDVHHIDENRLNNDPSNLLVLTKGDHKRLHNAKNPNKRDEKTGRFLPKENTGI